MKLFQEIHKKGNTIILVTHEEDIAAYGIYVGLIEAMKEYAPMDALPESPLPRQRLLEIALARWSRKE